MIVNQLERDFSSVVSTDSESPDKNQQEPFSLHS